MLNGCWDIYTKLGLKFVIKKIYVFILNLLFGWFFQELISMISGRLPADVEMSIRQLMGTYASNITSVICQFPSQQVVSLHVFCWMARVIEALQISYVYHISVLVYLQIIVKFMLTSILLYSII